MFVCDMFNHELHCTIYKFKAVTTITTLELRCRKMCTYSEGSHGANRQKIGTLLPALLKLEDRSFRAGRPRMNPFFLEIKRCDCTI